MMGRQRMTDDVASLCFSFLVESLPSPPCPVSMITIVVFFSFFLFPFFLSFSSGAGHGRGSSLDLAVHRRLSLSFASRLSTDIQEISYEKSNRQERHLKTCCKFSFLSSFLSFLFFGKSSSFPSREEVRRKKERKKTGVTGHEELGISARST